MMTLFIDESGNTGETLIKELKFNFEEQPYYVLCGIFDVNSNNQNLIDFISTKKEEYKIQGVELKSKNLYYSKPRFISDVVDYLINNNIAIFIELMDKMFYLNIQIVDHFILRNSELNNYNIVLKRLLASHLSKTLNQEIYHEFIKTTKEYTNKSLELFYDKLIDQFNLTNKIRSDIEKIKNEYYQYKKHNAKDALRFFTPLPDLNPHDKLIHLLPNYNAFTNIVGRVNKYAKEKYSSSLFKIIHDEQKQFDLIFEDALNKMKKINMAELIGDNFISAKSNFNIHKNLKIEFIDSKTNLHLQIADLIAGCISRFWIDFVQDNRERISVYLPIIRKIQILELYSNQGINYVVSDEIFKQFSSL